MATEKISQLTLISNASTTDLHEVSRLVSTGPDVWVSYSESNAQLITLLETELPSVKLNNTGLQLKAASGNYYLTVSPGSTLTANRTLTVTTGDSNRTLTMGGNINFANSFQAAGNYPVVLNFGASTNITVPSTGTLATLAGTEILTNKTINGLSNTLSNIANASLVNSVITINGFSVSLGGSTTVTAASPYALTVSTGLSFNSGTTYDGSAAKTISINSSVVTLTGTQTLTNKSISGSSNTLTNIGNSSLVYDYVTINDVTVNLGASAEIPSILPNSLTAGTGLQFNSGATFNGSVPKTMSVDTNTVIVTTGSQTAENKTLINPIIKRSGTGTSEIWSSTWIVDYVDQTKYFDFDLSGLTAGKTMRIKPMVGFTPADEYAWIIPEGDGDQIFVAEDLTQNVSNKTFFDSTLFSGSVVVGSGGGATNFTDLSNATKKLFMDLSVLDNPSNSYIRFYGTVDVSFPTGSYTVAKTGANTFTGAQSVTPVTLTSSSNHVATDASLSNIFKHTLTENTTLDNPTNLVSGTIYTWIITQNASAAKTLAFGSDFTWPGGTALTVSTGLGAIDIITALWDGTKLRAVVSGQAFS